MTRGFTKIELNEKKEQTAVLYPSPADSLKITKKISI